MRRGVPWAALGGGRKSCALIATAGARRSAKPRKLALCASAPGSFRWPWTLGAVEAAHIAMGSLRMRPATAVTAPPEEPEL